MPDRASEWSKATKPEACPKCGDSGQITHEQDGSWSCATCGHGWKQ